MFRNAFLTKQLVVTANSNSTCGGMILFNKATGEILEKTLTINNSGTFISYLSADTVYGVGCLSENFDGCYIETSTYNANILYDTDYANYSSGFIYLEGWIYSNSTDGYTTFDFVSYDNGRNSYAYNLVSIQFLDRQNYLTGNLVRNVDTAPLIEVLVSVCIILIFGGLAFMFFTDEEDKKSLYRILFYVLLFIVIVLIALLLKGVFSG